MAWVGMIVHLEKKEWAEWCMPWEVMMAWEERR
jgi:hypothetical protein